MKSIKSKILIPFVLILTITPMITLLVFNVYFRNYIDSGIKRQLSNTVTTTQVLIKTELSETIYETNQDKINQSISDLNRILRTSKIALNTELLLFKETGEMIYPVNYENTFLTQELIGNIRNELKSLNVKDISSIDSSGRRFVVTGYRLTEIPLKNIPYIVFVSSMDESDPVFMTINFVLIFAMLFGVLFGALIAYRIAGGVEKPLKELCDATLKIGERKKFVLKHSTNIFEINQLSESIIKMEDRIEGYDKAQKAFLQNSSHELKTPLMSIQGYAEGIEAGLFPDVKKAGGIIKEESVKLDQLITELLVLSRIENQNYDTSLEKVHLNNIIKEYIQRCEGLALKNKKEIKLIISNETLKIEFNESLFTQSFMNIVSNAIRYASRTVTIELSSKAGNAIIEITDDGEGINPNDLEHVFERFYKGRNGQFGLGLAIAKSSALAMNGTISAHNTDKGAKFVLSFPIVA